MLVRCIEIDRQQVEITTVGAGPTRGDDAHEQFAQVTNLHDDAEIASRIPAEERKRVLAFGHDVTFVIVTKDADQDELEREITGLRRNVEGFAPFGRFSPGHGSTIATFDHHRDQAMHALSSEGRLHHRSGAAPDVTVTDDQTVPQQHFHPLEAGPLDVLAVASCQDAANLVRVIDEIRQTTVGSHDADQIAVVPLQYLQRRQRIRVDPERDGVFGSRRSPVCGLGLGHGYRQGTEMAVETQAQ